MTIATGSPTCLTSVRASGQCSGVLTSTPGGTQAIGSGAAKSRSSAVNTPWMPSRSSAAEPSMETIRACASGERTIAACSVPTGSMSSM